MILTPTYHIFEMYSVHQDATMVPIDVQSETYAHGDYSFPAVSATASVDADGKLHISLSNASPHKEIAVSVFVRGYEGKNVSGRILAGESMNAHNTFEQPNRVQPKSFSGATRTADGLTVTLPKMSVVALEVS
jgi:alpha-N-arabinofuranosidase